MARLSQEKWEELKADWCIGKHTNRALGERYGVSNVAITKKAAIEGWEKLDENIVDDFVENQIQTKLAINEVSKVSKINPANLLASLDRHSADKEIADSVGMNLFHAINQNIVGAEAVDIQRLAAAHKSIYDGRFKTTPDTAIQINTGEEKVEKMVATSDDLIKKLRGNK